MDSVAAHRGAETICWKTQYRTETEALLADQPSLRRVHELNRSQLKDIFEFYAKRSKRRTKKGECKAIRFLDMLSMFRDFSLVPRVCDLSMDRIFFNLVLYNEGQIFRKPTRAGATLLSSEQLSLHYISQEMVLEILVRMAVRYPQRLKRKDVAAVTSSISLTTNTGQNGGIEYTNVWHACKRTTNVLLFFLISNVDFLISLT